MKTKTFSSFSVLVVILILVVFLAACEPATTPTSPETPSVTDSPTVAPSSSPISPTETPGTPTVIIISNREGDELSDPEAWVGREIHSYIYMMIERLTSRYSMDLIADEEVVEENLTSNIKVVVSTSPTDDFPAIAARHPEVQFIAVDHPGFSPSENLSLIGEQEEVNQQQAFMAGYLSALISEDYKVAALIPSEVENSETLTEIFVNGARFFCGDCRPFYPPYNSFPQWETLPIELSSSDFEATIDALMAKEIEVLFVDGRLASKELFTYLNNWDLMFVSDSSLFFHEWMQLVRNNWAGTIRPDVESALEEIFPLLLEGQGNHDVPVRMVVTSTEEGLISEGRQRVFDEFADDLLNGLISPETVP